MTASVKQTFSIKYSKIFQFLIHILSINVIGHMVPYAMSTGNNHYGKYTSNILNKQLVMQPSPFLNNFQPCAQQHHHSISLPHPSPYSWLCLDQQQDRNTDHAKQRIGGSVMVYRLIFRPPYTWTYNCFCDCEENSLYVPRVPGQHANFTEANIYVKRQLHEAVMEAFRSIGIIPEGLIVTTSFWPYPAFIVNDINIAKATYIKGKYFYTLTENTLALRCEAKTTATCVNKGNYKSFQEVATLTVDILNVLTKSQQNDLTLAIQQSLENYYVTFIFPVQLLDDNDRNKFILDP